MVKFCSLYSSSSGNCTYIGTESSAILIDIGISAKRAEEALQGIGVSPSDIKAVFITHEHSDHINGVRVFASRYNVPVYSSTGTLQGMDAAGVFRSNVEAYVIPRKGIDTDGIFVKSFPVSHDTPEPVGYTISAEGKKIATVTDTGIITNEIKDAVKGSDLVLLESNHDVSMLLMGAYPYILKQRILSDEGHLSNDSCAEFAGELLQSGTKRFILGHLSRENNIPSLAFETTKAVLEETGEKYSLTVAGDLNSPIIME